MEIDRDETRGVADGDGRTAMAGGEASRGIDGISHAVQILYSDDPVVAQQAFSAAQRVFTNLEAHKTVSNLRHWASRILKQLARTRGELNPSLVEKAVQPLIGILSTTDADRACDRADSAFMLGSIASGGSRCSDAIARTGVVADLVRLIGTVDVTLPAEREMAAFAIAKLSHKPAENARVVDGAGGLRPLVNLLEVGTVLAQEYAAEAIWCLARVRESAQALVRLGCVRRLLALVRSASAPARVKAHASHALGVFGIHKRIRRLIVDGGGIEALTEILRSNLDLTTRINAANTLGILAVQLEDTSRIANAGAIPSVISLLFESDQRAREIGEDNLCVIASSFSNAISIAKHLTAIAMDVSRSWDDRSTAVDSIWDLATYSHCVNAVGAASIIPNLISLLDEEEPPASEALPLLPLSPTEPPSASLTLCPSEPSAYPSPYPASQPSSSIPTLCGLSNAALNDEQCPSLQYPTNDCWHQTLPLNQVHFNRESNSGCGASSSAHVPLPNCHLERSSCPLEQGDTLPRESLSVSCPGTVCRKPLDAGHGSASPPRTEQASAVPNRKRPLYSDEETVTPDGALLDHDVEMSSPVEDSGTCSGSDFAAAAAAVVHRGQVFHEWSEVAGKSPRVALPSAECNQKDQSHRGCDGPSVKGDSAERVVWQLESESDRPKVSSSCQKVETAGCSLTSEKESDSEDVSANDSRVNGETGTSARGRMPNAMREGIAGAFAALSTDEDNRMMMVEAGVIPALGKLLKDPLEDVRDSAAEALYHLSREHCYRPDMIRSGLFQILSDVRPDDDQQLGVRVYHFSRVIRRRLLWAMEYEDMKEHQPQEEQEHDDDDEARGDDDEDGRDEDDSDEGMDFTTFVDMECDVEEYLSLMTGADGMMD